MRNLFQLALVLMLGFFFTGFVSAQEGKVKGTVKNKNDELITGATIVVKGTNIGTITDVSGNYTLDVPTGKQAIKVSFTGYKPVTMDVNVKEDEVVTKDAVLKQASYALDKVIVTGVQNEKTVMESSVAISTMEPRQIAQLAPQSSADLIKSVPGFYVESSGGKGNANVFARGLPSSGGLRYVQIQEDGLPVFEYGDLMFGNTDIWVRVDQNVNRMESVRGGSASLLTSNAPGGIVNMISKTGGSQFKGKIKQTLGVTYMKSRTDIDFGGPISDKIRYHVGGFYRTDEGVRSPGFTANEGGQIKANTTFMMDNGYIRLRTKYLNDQNIAYLPIPLKGDPAEGVEGFDPNYGTMKSLDLMQLHATTPNGTEVNEDLSAGMNPEVFNVGGKFFLEVGDGWTIKDNFKKSYMNGQFNSIFAAGGPYKATDYAENVQGLSNYHYAYANGGNAGKPINNPDNMNGNGRVGVYGWWDVDIPLEQFANNFSISKDFGENSLTGGWYSSTNTVSANWWWHDKLVDISDNTRSLDLVNEDTGESITDNGFVQYGSLYRHYRALTSINALYLNGDFSLGDLSIDAGVRYDIGKTHGWTEKASTFSYDVDADGDTSLAEQGVQYGTGDNIPFKFNYQKLSWSLGLNYKFSQQMAMFGRASQGHRAPADRAYAFGATEGTANGFPENTSVESIYQFELGGKYNTENISLFATGFYSLFNDIVFTDFVERNGNLESVQEYYSTSAVGVEAEMVANFGDFEVNFTGTFQDLQYNDWIYRRDDNENGTIDAPDEVYDFDGNQVQRIPKMYFTLRPSYQLGPLNASVTWQYFSKRFTNPSNQQELPAFSEFNAQLAYDVSDNMQISVTGNNLTNVIGLTEGNPRTGLTGVQNQYFYARPVLGRSVVASISYRF